MFKFTSRNTQRKDTPGNNGFIICTKPEALIQEHFKTVPMGCSDLNTEEGEGGNPHHVIAG